MKNKLERRDFLRIGTLGLLGWVLQACGVRENQSSQSPTLSAHQIATQAAGNLLHAQETAVYLAKNPEALEAEIAKIPDRLWLSAVRIIAMNWSIDENNPPPGGSYFGATPNTGSCTILEGGRLGTAGHMLAVPQLKLTTITLDFPQAVHDSMKGLPLTPKQTELRTRSGGVTLKVKSTAYRYDANDPDVSDIGVIQLEELDKLEEGLPMVRFNQDRINYALLNSNPLKLSGTGAPVFGVEDQEYLPLASKASYVYPGKDGAKFIVIPNPSVRGMSGVGIYNDGWAAAASFSGLDSQNNPVLVATAAEGIYETLLKEL